MRSRSWAATWAAEPKCAADPTWAARDAIREAATHVGARLGPRIARLKDTALAHYAELALLMDEEYRVVARRLELYPTWFLKLGGVVQLHPDLVLVRHSRYAPRLRDRKDRVPHAD